VRRALAIAALTILAVVTVAPRADALVTAQEQPAARLALASQTPWVRGAQPFTIRLDVDGVRRPQRLALSIVVHRAVTSRSQFARTIDGELLGASVQRDEVPFQSLRFDPGGAIPVTVALPSLREGVYPVSVSLVDTDTDDAVASFVTHLVKVAEDAAEHPLRVAWVQPFGTAPALGPDGVNELGTDALDDLRTVAAHLDDGAPLTVVPTPETVDALRTVDDGRALAALARLVEGHQVLATPFVDLDLASLVRAGRDADIARQRLVGDATLQETLRVSADTRTWSVTGSLSERALRAINELGVTRVVVDGDAMEPLPTSVTRGLTLTRPFALGGAGDTEVDAVAVDAGLSAHFEEPDDVLGAHLLLADLAVLHFDSPGTTRGVVVRPPDGWRPSDIFFAVALANIAGSPLLEPVTVDRFLADVDPLVDDDEPVVRELVDTDPPALGFASSDLDEARSAMDGLASLLEGHSSDDLTVMDRLLLVAESSDLRASARREYVDAVVARVEEASSRVRALGDRTYRLTAREGTIPLTLVNDNDFEVRVDVELTSDKLDFSDSRDPGRLVIHGLVLAANRTTTEAVPVKARTSGAFPLRVSVRSPDGRLQLGGARYTITSTVASGVGILLSVGAGGFLLLWWASHWRTVRRARRLVDAD
jgi:hypothetical protein